LQLRYVHARIVTSAAPALLAVLLFFTPIPAAGQWAQGATEWVTLEVPPTPSPDGVWERASLPLGSPAAGLTLAPSTHNPTLVLEQESLKKRLLPYALAGAIVGGLLGYAAHEGVFWNRERCDGDLNPLCPVTPYAYAFVGAAVGTWTGILVGYVRERR
jgi:hypothetical protein